MIFLASTMRGTKLIIEKTILIQHINDIKGTNKPKYIEYFDLI